MRAQERRRKGLYERLAEKRALHRESSRSSNVLLGMALAVGMFLLLYPSASDYWNSFHQSQAIMKYAEQVAGMSEEEYRTLIAAAGAYNQELSRSKMNWNLSEAQTEAYEGQLSFNDAGNMGYLSIPKINVQLPVYHGVSEQVLQTSIGHIPGSSLPVGGPGTHCVLSGHRGLPSARLFSDLDRVVEGDTFSLSILNETCTYEVDRIRVVLPSDVSDLQMVPGQDYCTLVTCTPYGVNTHRLLVRGHRVENPHGDARVVADALQMKPAFVAPFLMLPLILGLLLLLVTMNPDS